MEELMQYRIRLGYGVNAADLMTEMEKEYGIPAINDEAWNANHKDIIDTYRYLADSRWSSPAKRHLKLFRAKRYRVCR